MVYKLVFDHPEEVSPLLEEDKLLIEFNITTAVFLGGSSAIYFDPTLLSLTTRIPKQLEETTLTIVVQESARRAYHSLQYSFFISLAINLVVSGILS